MGPAAKKTLSSGEADVLDTLKQYHNNSVPLSEFQDFDKLVTKAMRDARSPATPNNEATQSKLMLAATAKKLGLRVPRLRSVAPTLTAGSRARKVFTGWCD